MTYIDDLNVILKQRKSILEQIENAISKTTSKLKGLKNRKKILKKDIRDIKNGKK